MVEKFIKYENNGTLSWEGTVSVGSLSGNASYEVSFEIPVRKAIANDNAVLCWCTAAGERRQGRWSFHDGGDGVRAVEAEAMITLYILNLILPIKDRNCRYSPEVLLSVVCGVLLH